jgi:hypothetical protein
MNEKELWNQYGCMQQDEEVKLGKYYSYQFRLFLGAKDGEITCIK